MRRLKFWLRRRLVNWGEILLLRGYLMPYRWSPYEYERAQLLLARMLVSLEDDLRAAMDYARLRREQLANPDPMLPRGDDRRPMQRAALEIQKKTIDKVIEDS